MDTEESVVNSGFDLGTANLQLQHAVALRTRGRAHGSLMRFAS